jgi:phosphatidylglycerol:prolipoprotein diacylglycerol transferase
MIDPVIFSFKLFSWQITLRWYGVLVMLGTLVGTWIAEKEIRRRGGNGDSIWDALVWVLPFGVIGARLWYVVNSILGGSRYYLDDPAAILRITEGGLHFFGGLLFGAIVLFIYLKRNNLDLWLFLDAVAPVTLIGQAIARPANYINQELYGQPTRLPWGIPIEAQHRLVQYSDLNLFPVESTRFHPTFAYEMLWNFAAAAFLIWYSRAYKERLKPGAVFAAWLVLAGVGRVIIEFFRPDQPRIPGTDISYTTVVSALMAVAGVVMLLVRYGRLQLSFAEGWEARYKIPVPEKRLRAGLTADAESVRGRQVATQSKTKAGSAKKPAPSKQPHSKPKLKTKSSPGTKRRAPK